MTGEQRSADGWQENREKRKRGVRVEDGDFFERKTRGVLGEEGHSIPTVRFS